MLNSRQKTTLCALAFYFLQPSFVARAVPAPIPDMATIRRCQERAERHGRSDGQSDGAEFGREWHYQQGFDYRYRTEYDACFRRLVDEAIFNGQRSGQMEGEQSGQAKGQLDGERDGLAEGRLKGGKDGEAKADHQAQMDVREPATREGQEQARLSDAVKSGEQKGTSEGDSQAMKVAKDVDYSRGTRSYAGELFAQQVTKSIKMVFSPSGNLPIKAGRGGGGSEGMFAGTVSRRSEGSRYHPGASPSFPTSQENEAYRLAYSQAYRRAFDNACDSCRSDAYRRGENDAINRALSDARNQDFGRYFLDGKQRGFHQAFDAVYGQIRQQAYQNAFNREYQVNVEQAYRQTYEGFRQRHYSSTRDAAYQKSYQELFEAARQKLSAATQAQKYPIYSKQQYFKGRQEEKLRFGERPLRLVSLQPYLVQKSDGSAPTSVPLSPGVGETYHVEPGQEIQLRFRARNFGPECRSSVQLVVESGEGFVYLPENLFTANGGFPAGGLLAADEGSPRLTLRQNSAGQSVSVKVILRSANGESDERTVQFIVKGDALPAPGTP